MRDVSTVTRPAFGGADIETSRRERQAVVGLFSHMTWFRRSGTCSSSKECGAGGQVGRSRRSVGRRGWEMAVRARSTIWVRGSAAASSVIWATTFVPSRCASCDWSSS